MCVLEPVIDWDHPRARGEQQYGEDLELAIQGSSPRARGAGRGIERRSDGQGIIPARAGSRSSLSSMKPSSWDHPRARGEQLSTPSRESAEEGSSPRARGAGPLTEDNALTVGIIPARAGSRLNPQLLEDFARDHPRARGAV